MPQYISVILNKEKYAIPMINVQEVVKYENIVKVPGSDNYIIGVINLRNKTIPIMNLKDKLNLRKDISKDSKIVILTKKGSNLGIIVDDTSEIIDVGEKDVEKINNNNFSTVIRKNEHLYKVIEIDNLFEGDFKDYTKEILDKHIKDEHEELIQILKFKLGNEIMAIPVENVQEIVKKPLIYSIPDMPNFVKGVMTLRGEIIQIIDLNALFKKNNLNLKELIIIKINGIKFGLHVEEVKNITSVEINAINKLPVTSKNSKVIGVINLNSEIITLLDLEKIFDELGIEIEKIVLDENEKGEETIDESKLFLIFKLIDEDYAIEIEKVREVTVLENEKVKDVVNIRGEVIPLIDLNEKFNNKNTNSKNIVIIKGKEKDFGLIVDEVEEITRINKSKIEKVPDEVISDTSTGEYLKNIINQDSNLIFIINAEKLEM
ncbi:Chemotaxis signal transduction protein [Marinitoga hydrogenitolerans DSM 16785]|uniref:Chemotaxis signal transduction protein n=1 Tax=Marinitoga hydrogenitolerans (strain DSM 16785 / JCM 12826 / AT1271) TaxID=1122195 RepID=A0A1M5A433_MARH1|nr:chemotaxis protein CheW [Marinitoga hydrogenitolerans]SHF24696.1 Chemotaxis signal transduction protein [Marinitoga hydrogenitolerans DSM 16785]